MGLHASAVFVLAGLGTGLDAQTNSVPPPDNAPAAALTNALSSTNAATLSDALSSRTNGAPHDLDPSTVNTPATPAGPPQAMFLPPGFAPTKPDDQIADIRPPVFHLQSPSPLTWITAVLLTMAAVAAVLWFWPRSHRQLSPGSAYDVALEKLDRARALMQEEQPMPYAVLVSETVRDYLGQRFHAPSTHRTTNEFLRQMESDPNTPLANHRDLLRDFLQACDLVKFARYQPTMAELGQVQERAVRFVQATRPESAQAGRPA